MSGKGTDNGDVSGKEFSAGTFPDGIYISVPLVFGLRVEHLLSSKIVKKDLMTVLRQGERWPSKGTLGSEVLGLSSSRTTSSCAIRQHALSPLRPGFHI